ncbi:MOSC domain-containing protein [Jiangella ureilytica]|uniref:MOSC domain-containing protein n=1 Tax=Jiangella ureilytica TaxID=2530374 RepID=A0A4R4RGB2_9ACTN|nr:MOSC domain-containing protein [Jiangella ureilytica]TDC48438.1 MOSC domain-containing protein [Jiangella ureilytica]
MAQVVGVNASPRHEFGKEARPLVRLLAGLGVEGDAHLGTTVQHLSRLRRDPKAPNLRQVHLIHAELHDELAAAGYAVGPGQLGENVTTRGVDLLGLATGTRLRLGPDAVIEVTGLRNPCYQIDDFQQGVLKEVVGRDAAGAVVRKAGIMAIVLVGGEVRPGDAVTVDTPPEPHRPLVPV